MSDTSLDDEEMADLTALAMRELAKMKNLRDEFAMAVAPAYMRAWHRNEITEQTIEEVAEAIYYLADAMLKARDASRK